MPYKMQEAIERAQWKYDESYFGARRVRGKKGHGAGGKAIVFGILERHRRHRKVSEIVPDASKKKLQSVIRGQVVLEASSTQTAGEATMGWWTWATKSISGCIMVMHEFTRSNCHINGIESFRSYAKRRLVKFNAVPQRGLPVKSRNAACDPVSCAG